MNLSWIYSVSFIVTTDFELFKVLVSNMINIRIYNCKLRHFGSLSHTEERKRSLRITDITQEPSWRSRKV